LSFYESKQFKYQHCIHLRCSKVHSELSPKAKSLCLSVRWFDSLEEALELVEGPPIGQKLTTGAYVSTLKQRKGAFFVPEE